MKTPAKHLLAALAWTCAAAVSAAPAAGESAGQQGLLRFEVLLDDRMIGEHALAFETRPDGSLGVAIEIGLEIKFGPFTVFTYDHRNRTEWQAGRLVSLRSRTNENGTPHRLRATAGTAGLEVFPDGDAPYVTDASVLPTTYWMAATTRQNTLLNSQTGELLEISARPVGRDTVPGPDGAIPATRYRLDGDLEIELWYDDSGVLVGLAFEARGSRIIYRLAERRGHVPVRMTGRAADAQHPTG